MKNVDVPYYLVSWKNYTKDTWEPIYNFPDEINTYPGYNKSLSNLLKVKKKIEKETIENLILFKKFEKKYYYT